MVSLSVSRRVWITEPALEKAASEAAASTPMRRRAEPAAAYCAEIEMRPQHHEHAGEADVDRRPAIDAHALLEETAPTSATVISGEAKEIAVASTSGSRASAAKLRNMPATLIRPRPKWPNGRSVRTAAGKLAAPGIDQHHRQDREGGAEEHHLPERHRSPR